VHAWDLGRCAAIDVEIADDAIEFAHDALDGIPPDRLRSPGVFAAEVAPPPGATASEAFVAWTGRDSGWSMP
jgi:hypothetical protein